jgi:hypothetical protein
MTIEEENEENVQEESKEKEKISVYRTPLFTKLYATNLRVFRTDVDFRIELFNEKFESEEETVFYSDGIAMLTPEAAKKLMVELTRAVEKYELENGEILVREERKNCEFADE